MSHHVSASASNPTGAVEVVRVNSSATTTAPVDGGSSAATGATAPTPTGTGADVSTAATPTAQPVSTPVAGQSGLPGANLPVPNIEQASNTIQSAKADLSRTAGAERRLDGFDLVGGGDGGGGGGGEAEASVADEGQQDAVAAATEDLNVSGEDNGLGAARLDVGQEADLTSDPSLGSDQGTVQALTSEQIANSAEIEATAAEQGLTQEPAVSSTGEPLSANAGQQTDPRSVL